MSSLLSTKRAISDFYIQPDANVSTALALLLNTINKHQRNHPNGAHISPTISTRLDWTQYSQLFTRWWWHTDLSLAAELNCFFLHTLRLNTPLLPAPAPSSLLFTVNAAQKNRRPPFLHCGEDLQLSLPHQNKKYCKGQLFPSGRRYRSIKSSLTAWRTVWLLEP